MANKVTEVRNIAIARKLKKAYMAQKKADRKAEKRAVKVKERAERRAKSSENEREESYDKVDVYDTDEDCYLASDGDTLTFMSRKGIIR